MEFRRMTLLRVCLFLALSTALAAPAGAVGLRQVIRDCGADGKTYCDGVGYGAPMQTCLARNKSRLAPACRAIIDRLEKGEEVEIFG
jgi:hypothetical protein